jgi:hypothetical protein
LAFNHRNFPDLSRSDFTKSTVPVLIVTFSVSAIFNLLTICVDDYFIKKPGLVKKNIPGDGVTLLHTL